MIIANNSIRGHSGGENLNNGPGNDSVPKMSKALSYLDMDGKDQEFSLFQKVHCYTEQCIDKRQKQGKANPLVKDREKTNSGKTELERKIAEIKMRIDKK